MEIKFPFKQKLRCNKTFFNKWWKVWEVAKPELKDPELSHKNQEEDKSDNVSGHGLIGVITHSLFFQNSFKYGYKTV